MINHRRCQEPPGRHGNGPELHEDTELLVAVWRRNDGRNGGDTCACDRRRTTTTNDVMCVPSAGRGGRCRTSPSRCHLPLIYRPIPQSCPSFLLILIFTTTGVFDTSGGRRRCQPFFHVIPLLADSRPIVLSFINNLPAVLNIMFSITIGSA